MQRVANGWRVGLLFAQVLSYAASMMQRLRSRFGGKVVLASRC
jgi:hypothetical protein